MIIQALKLIAFVLSLGVDTLFLAISLGAMQKKNKVRSAIVFACAESLTPLLGLIIGKAVGRWLGDWASLFGGLILMAMSIWMLFFAEEEAEEERLAGALAGWALLFAALSISVDELSVGFSIGMIGVPIALTMVLIAVQAGAFTWIGMSFGAKLKPLLGERIEKMPGIALGLLGIWIFIAAIAALS